VGSSGLIVRPASGPGVLSLLAVALAAWGFAVVACALATLLIDVVPGAAAIAHSALGAKPGVVPHPASGRTVGYALGLLVNNALVALWPLTGLFLLRDAPRSWRRAFIGVVVVSALRSVVPLAAAVGLWGTRLLPYIPNAPFELGAITTSGVLYVLRSEDRISLRALRYGTAAVGLLLLIAAALETWAVPVR
jgi:hypothetical protein